MDFHSESSTSGFIAYLAMKKKTLRKHSQGYLVLISASYINSSYIIIFILQCKLNYIEENS